MNEKIASRHLWAADLVAAAPGEIVLEIGCGHGLATGLVANALGADGHLVAIDRSAKMVEACRSRNVAAIAAGRLTVIAGLFETTAFDQRFDKAFAVNVDFPLHKDLGWAQTFAAVLRKGGMSI